MVYLEYFKLQAKNLFRAFKAKTRQHFTDDVEYIILCEYGYDEGSFSLMNAQHIIALMCGLNKWSDFIVSSGIELELAKLLFDNRNRINVEDWCMYVAELERDDIILDAESKLKMLKQGWLDMPTEDSHPDIRL